MKAAVQQVDFNIDAGRTAISFGPPEHLGAQDSITLLNANRTRITRYSNDSRSSSTAYDETDTSGTTPNNKAGTAAPRMQKMVLSDQNGDNPVTIEIDTAQVKKGKTIVGQEDDSGDTTKTFAGMGWPTLHKKEDEEEEGA